MNLGECIIFSLGKFNGSKDSLFLQGRLNTESTVVVEEEGGGGGVATAELFPPSPPAPCNNP